LRSVSDLINEYSSSEEEEIGRSDANIDCSSDGEED